MWKETEILEKIVVKTAIISHESESIHLQERSPTAVLKDVYVDNVSSDGITLKADCHAESFFRKNYGNRRCDYIILSKARKKRVALFLDMKSTHFADLDIIEEIPHDLGHGYPDYVHQLRSSSCFFDFLHTVMKEFCFCNALEKYNKTKRRYFVVLHAKDISQIIQPITRTRPRKNNKPDTALVLHVNNNDHLLFESLVLA